MAIERFWEEQGPVSFTADGGENGLITLSSVLCFKVRQQVRITAIGEPTLSLEVKRVISPTQLYVGAIKSNPRENHNLKKRTDLSAYTVAKLASIHATEQPKPRIKPEDIIQAAYEQEPTLAHRVFPVDKVGRPYTSDNPFPVDGDFSVSLETTPDTQEIQNISVVNANTEFSIALPDGTKRYFIKVRNHSAKGRIAFTTGETSTNYWGLTRGIVFDSEDINLPISTTIYMQLDKADQVVEVISLYKS